MDLLALVDRLEELVGSAQKMPIGSRAIIDRRRLLDLVDQMRISIPQEVRDAQTIVANREELHRAAEEEARLVVARAEDRAARMVEAHELTTAAGRRAVEIARQADARLEERIQQANADIEQRIAESRRIAGQQMDAADEYASELLGRLDRQLQAFVRSVQSGIAQLQAAEASHSIREAGSATLISAAGAVNALGIADPLAPTSRGPVLLRRDESVASAGAEGELEDLLRRRPLFAPPQPEPAPRNPDDPAPVIIDDFAMPALDDAPPHRDEDSPER
jgi:hypothetical protein